MVRKRNLPVRETASSWLTPPVRAGGKLGLTLFIVFAFIWRGLPLLQDLSDTYHYGDPRVMRLDAVVGHGDSPEHPTLLLAMNLDRDVSVIEVPGGDVAKARTLRGPHLFGYAGDRVAVTVKLVHANADNLLDLVVVVDGEELLYVNENDTFRLASQEERGVYAAGKER